jgi:hypothetical protein
MHRVQALLLQGPEGIFANSDNENSIHCYIEVLVAMTVERTVFFVVTLRHLVKFTDVSEEIMPPILGP